MPTNRSLISGSASMLILGLICREDMYGYQIIEQLKRRSDNAFDIKAGTLYPILHSLEKDGFIKSYERLFNGKLRKYYSITDSGRKVLERKQQEWFVFTRAVLRVMEG